MAARLLSLLLVLWISPSLAGAVPGGTAPATRRYREATAHSPASLHGSRHRLDWANQPALYRTYPGAERLPLPPPSTAPQPALDAIAHVASGRTRESAPIDLRMLGTLLFLARGISGSRESGGDLRVTAAAGGLYPNELYIVNGDLPELPAGVYHYDPKHAVLHRLRRGDWRPWLAHAAADERLRGLPATLVLTGIPWRSAWKYRERAYRHLYWDGGMVLAHVLAAATAAGVPATILAAFVDADVDRLLGADGRREMALALVPLGVPEPRVGPPLGAAAAPPPLKVEPSTVAAQSVDYPESLRYHAASGLAERSAVERLRAATIPPPRLGKPPGTRVALPAPARSRGDPALGAVVRRRRSTRRFAPHPITPAELAAVLERPTRGIAADFLGRRPTLLETYVIVNAVVGLPAGTYHYDRDAHALASLQTGDFRTTAGFLSLGQALAREASAVLYYLADLETVAAAFGERGYRFAELEAGIVAGRAYLAAYAVGRGATGLTFYDEDVTRFFAPHAAALDPLLVVAVGVPARRVP
jgi:SagB-type dehydrogenase family enzyme